MGVYDKGLMVENITPPLFQVSLLSSYLSWGKHLQHSIFSASDNRLYQSTQKLHDDEKNEENCYRKYVLTIYNQQNLFYDYNDIKLTISLARI